MAYSNNRGPRGRQNHKSSNGGLVGLAIVGGLFLLLGTNIIPFGVGIVMVSIDLLFVALPFVLIFYLIRKAAKKKKRKEQKKANRITTAEFLTMFKANVPASGRINLTDNIYLQAEEPDNINLKTISIYMRDEYIATLNDYITTFPTGYDSLVETLIGYFNESARVRSKNKKEQKVEEQPVITKPQVTIEKDCNYYIKKFSGMTALLTNEEISKSLQTSITYLQQIAKIEKEYPDAKKRTTKLYQIYMPMYLDLLENYQKLSSDVVDAEEFKAQEEYFHKTAYLINNALDTISSGLVDDYYTNFKVDMKTLESVLKKDGLVDTVEEQQ